jgi:ATP-binding cassette subfamily C protein CydD
MSFRPGYFILLIAPEYFLTLRMLGTFYHSRMEAVSAAEQIRALVEAPIAERLRAAAAMPAAPAKNAPPAITFDDVHFSYTGAPLFDGLSFAVAPGEHLALAGQSGGGKSTILSLLLGFATPQHGSILIDGVPLAGMDTEAWRRRIAWLPQRPTIFPGTVRDNIVLGRRAASEREIERAVRLAHVDEFLPRLPAGAETVLGEGGQGLSAGQAHRVALARLFLRAPSLVLLDEPTAHLDAVSARMVAEGIGALAEGRTTIIVSHTPGALGMMDRLVFLQGGRAEERT